MHPFGGTPICPRCQKVVYAAEQVRHVAQGTATGSMSRLTPAFVLQIMGPGRKVRLWYFAIERKGDG